MAAQIFQPLADHNISVDMIIQSQRSRQVHRTITRDIAFTVAEGDLPVAQPLLEQVAATLECGDVIADANIAKVSVVGAGNAGASWCGGPDV